MPGARVAACRPIGLVSAAVAEDGAAHELYSSRMIDMLEIVWGEGWLSPGGPEELDRILQGLDLSDKSVLDIGCGAGGLEALLIERHGAGYVTGIDVEDTVIEAARARIAKRGLADRVGIAKVWPGPLPFPPASFDVVFSKDSIIHIPDKAALAVEVFRVLKPGGVFAASDWLIGHDGEPSPEMKAYIAAEGLDFGMASPQRYREALARAGFENIAATSRNAWYRETARKERDRMAGRLYDGACAKLGRDYVDGQIALWTKMIGVLDTGEHCPTHLRAYKPR